MSSHSVMKIISAVFIVLILTGLSQLAPYSTDADAASPPPNDGIDGLQYIEGDWNVYGVEEYSNEIIELNGNLYIHEGGVLTFNNVTLRMNSTDPNKQYSIEVEGGGKFIIRDIDGDPETTNDASNITDSIYDFDNFEANQSDYRYFFMLDRDAYVEINNSFLREIGSKNGKYSTEGLYSNSAILIIRNTTISNCYKAVLPAYNNFDGARNLLIENSTIHDCDYGIYVESSYYNEIMFNKFYDIKYNTIYISYSDYTRIYNSSFYNCSKISNGYTIYNYRSNYLKVYGCTFKNSYDVIYIENSQYTYFEYSSFIEIANNALYFNQNRFSYSFCLNNYFDNITGYTYYLKEAQYVNVINNYFNNTKNTIIRGIKTNRLVVEGNYVENASMYFIYITVSSSSYVKVIGNTVDCKNMASPAVFMADCHYFEVDNNYIFNAKNGIIISGALYPNFLRNNDITGRGALTSGYGIRLDNTDQITMENIMISGFAHGIEGYYATKKYPTYPIEIYYGTITQCTNDFYLEYSSNFNVYNVSFDPSSVYFDSSPETPTINLFYTVHVHVSDASGNVGGALVTVTNATKQFEVNKYTIENGYAYDLLVLNGTYQNGKTYYATPYNFSANISGSVAYAPADYIVDKFKVISIKYDNNTYPAPPFNLKLELNNTSLDLTWECYVSDLKSYRVYRNDSSGGWVMYDEVISPPPGVMKKWVGEGQAINLVEYKYKIQHVDTASQEETNDIFVIFNDWVVADYKYMANRDIVINGSLFIENGGELELGNVNLMMNGTGPSPTYEMIEIRNGGTLTLTDIDDDPETEDDRTFINASEALGEYMFLVKPGGTLNMYNSHIQNSSYPIFEYLQFTAIMIDGGYFEIHNSTIMAYNYGIFAQGVDNSSIYGTTFQNYAGSRYTTAVYMSNARDISIESSYFNQSYAIDIYITEFQNLDIIGNTFICENSTAIKTANGDGLDISHNKIKRTDDSAISLEKVNDVIIDDNELWEFWNMGFHIYETKSLMITNNTLHDAPLAEAGFYLENVMDTILGLNTIDHVGSPLGWFPAAVAVIGFVNVTIAFNDIINCPYGIVMFASSTISDTGEVVVFNNTIRYSPSELSFGMGFQSCENVYIFNNTIFNFTYGVIIDSSDYIYQWNNSVYNCSRGFAQAGGEEVLYHQNVLKDVTYGFYFEWGARATIYNCTIYGLPPYTVYVNQSSEVVLINPYFNLSKVYVSDKTCKVQIMWAFDLIVRDQFGIPQKDIFVRIRNIYGTILEEKYTDSDGMVKYILVTTRIQFYASNLTNTPHSFEASLGSHSGKVQISVQSSATLQMQLDNKAPSAFNIVINPLTPKTTNNLELEYLYSDPENDPNLGTMVKWYRNGVHQMALDNFTSVPSSYTGKNDLWFCRVTPSDGADFGITSTSMTAIIYNTKPSVSDISLKPAYPDSTQDITVEYTFYDADGDSELGTIYKWKRKENGNFVEKETTNVPVLNHTKIGKNEEWMVTIVPKDGEASGDDFDSEPIVINNTPPSITNLKITPTHPKSTDELSVVYNFNDEDGDSEEGTKYQWYMKNGSNDFVPVDLGSSGIRIVSSEYLNRGDTWYCAVIPSDGLHAGEEVNSDEVVIDNTPMQIISLRILPVSPETDSELSVEYEYYDKDGDVPADFDYEWLIWSDTGEIYLRTGLRFEKLPAIYTVKGDIWTCEVTSNDGYTYGSPVLSEPVSIGNSAPQVNSLNIVPENPKTDDDLNADYHYRDLDGDIESGTTIMWYKDGQHRSELDNLVTVDSQYTRKGERWYFKVTPWDGFINGTEKQSAEIEIQNSPPEPRSPGFMNTAPRGDEDLVISYTYHDPDGDVNRRTDIRWYKNGILQPHLNDFSIVPANETAKDQEWYYQIRVSDGDATSNFNESFPVTIRNAKPVLLDFYPTISPIILNETESVKFGVNVIDMDDDALYYSWTLINQDTFETESIGEDPSIIMRTSFDDAGRYKLNVTIEDWDVNSFKIYYEWTVIIRNYNRLPSITVVEPENGELSIHKDGTLKFEISASDEDTEDTLNITWLVDGTNTHITKSSYLFTATGFSATVHTVVVEVDDGYDTVSKQWNVSVEAEKEDLIYGRTWDEWSVLLQVLVILATAIVALVGFFKLRKKKGALHEYLRRIEEPMKKWEEDPDRSEGDLIEVSEQIEKDFNEGILEDLQYFLLDRQIKENLREIRQERVGSAFSYLPPAIHKELEIMLDDGKLTENEYQTFIGILSQASGLTAQQKAEIKAQLQRWRDVDKKRSELKSDMLNSKYEDAGEKTKGTD